MSITYDIPFTNSATGGFTTDVTQLNDGVNVGGSDWYATDPGDGSTNQISEYFDDTSQKFYQIAGGAGADAVYSYLFI